MSRTTDASTSRCADSGGLGATVADSHATRCTFRPEPAFSPDHCLRAGDHRPDGTCVPADIPVLRRTPGASLILVAPREPKIASRPVATLGGSGDHDSGPSMV